MTMTSYKITTRSTGFDLGTYTASTAREAIEAMHLAAGYRSLEDAAQQLGQTVEALLADLVASATSQSLEADVADAMIARDCAEIDALDTHDIVAAQAADGTLDCEWGDRDIATMLRDVGAVSDDDDAVAKVRRIYVRRMRREFSEVAS